MVEKLAATEAQVVQLLDELNTVKATHDAELRRHTELVSQLGTDAASKDVEVVDLEERLATSNAEVTRMRSTFMELNERIAALVDEAARSATTIDSLKESLAFAKADLVEMEAKYDAKTKELEKVWSNLRQASDDGLDNQETIIKLRSQLETAQSERETLRQATAKAEESVERSTKEFTAYKRCMEDRISERQSVVCEIQSFSESKQRELREKITAIQTSRDELVNEISDALKNFGNHFAESSVDPHFSFERQDTWQESLKCATSLVVNLLDHERTVSSRLESKLGDAHLELERAATDISNTTNALSESRAALETLQRAFSEKAEVASRYCQERDDAYSRLVFMTGKLEEASRDEEHARVGVSERDALLNEHRQEVECLQVRVEQLESKNLKLRDYIRKLTFKCEEWQESWEQQSRIILELRNS